MNNINFEDFIELCWDYVSENVVSDDYWEKEQELIREITHSFFKRFKRNADGLTPKQYGRLIESIFITIQKKELVIS